MLVVVATTPGLFRAIFVIVIVVYFVVLVESEIVVFVRSARRAAAGVDGDV